VNCVTGFLDVMTAVVTGGVMNKRPVDSDADTGDAPGTVVWWGSMDSPTPIRVLLLDCGENGKLAQAEVSIGGCGVQTGIGGVNSGVVVYVFD
jgi:hypothetical protein